MKRFLFAFFLEASRILRFRVPDGRLFHKVAAALSKYCNVRLALIVWLAVDRTRIWGIVLDDK